MVTIEQGVNLAGLTTTAGMVYHKAKEFISTRGLSTQSVAKLGFVGMGVSLVHGAQAFHRLFVSKNSTDRFADGMGLSGVALSLSAIGLRLFTRHFPIQIAIMAGGLLLDAVNLIHLVFEHQEDPQRVSKLDIVTQMGLTLLFGIDRPRQIRHPVDLFLTNTQRKQFANLHRQATSVEPTPDFLFQVMADTLHNEAGHITHMGSHRSLDIISYRRDGTLQLDECFSIAWSPFAGAKVLRGKKGIEGRTKADLDEDFEEVAHYANVKGWQDNQEYSTVKILVDEEPVRLFDQVVRLEGMPRAITPRLLSKHAIAQEFSFCGYDQEGRGQYHTKPSFVQRTAILLENGRFQNLSHTLIAEPPDTAFGPKLYLMGHFHPQSLKDSERYLSQSDLIFFRSENIRTALPHLLVNSIDPGRHYQLTFYTPKQKFHEFPQMFLALDEVVRQRIIHNIKDYFEIRRMDLYLS